MQDTLNHVRVHVIITSSRRVASAHMHTTRAPSLCTRTTSPALLHMTVLQRCVCAEAKDDVYGRARSEMFSVGVEL